MRFSTAGEPRHRVVSICCFDCMPVKCRQDEGDIETDTGVKKGRKCKKKKKILTNI